MQHNHILRLFIMNYQELFTAARRAGSLLLKTERGVIDNILQKVADRTLLRCDYILAENAKDLEAMDIASPNWDRLMLNRERVAAIAAEIRNVASLPSPLGIVTETRVRPNGMKIEKISVPFGVVGIVYEARPNVGFDSFSLCFKSGNAVILKGGSDAYHSNVAVVETIREVLIENGLPADLVTLLPRQREAVTHLLGAVGYVDLVIPRGSRSLIDFVRNNARVPVIETGAGICHTYIDRECDLEFAQQIITNAKCRRVSVCNSLDCVIIHHDRIGDLPFLCEQMGQKGVEIFADSDSYEQLKGSYPFLNHAREEHFGIEFLSLKLSIKTVDDIDQAMEHISLYSSKHSEAIVSSDQQNIESFRKQVDAACVYVNVSTAFTDGAEFGMGAEIGISTQKLHARGPMALQELTTYKYLITGQGQTRK